MARENPEKFDLSVRWKNRRPLVSYLRQGRELMRPFRRQVATVCLVAGLVVSGGVGAKAVIHRIWYSETGSPSNAVAKSSPPQTPELPQQTQLEVARNGFAPWHMLTADTTEAPAMLMLMDSGSTDVSDWSVTIDSAEWLKSEPFLLRSVEVHDRQATVFDAHGNVYHVSVHQPFMFESDPNAVYFVDSDGSVWSTTFATALTNRVEA